MWGEERSTEAMEDGSALNGRPLDGAHSAVPGLDADVLGSIRCEKQRAKAELLQVTAPMRRRLMDSLGEMLKGSMLADPDMWPSIRFCATAALDHMWADVEHEIERSLHYSLLKQRADADAQGPTAGPGVLGALLRPWWRFRAFVLHHYLPHNRYFFGKLKDPVYVFMYMVTLLPVHFIRVVVFSTLLLMIAFPGPPDEFQLINYILLFKGTQFLTSGVISMGFGALKYFLCYSLHKDDLLQCIETRGPGASDSVGQVADYLGNVTLVWIAFSLLPRSRRYAVQSPLLGQADTEEDRRAGGRLHNLLRYDIKCFAFSLLTLTVLTCCTCGLRPGGLPSSPMELAADPQFCANTYWCCVLYSVLSLPFASFAIPGWQTVLTHSDPTGFNVNGACVAFGISPVAKSAQKAEEAAPRSGFGFVHAAAIATNVLSVMERGRQARGSTTEGEYEFADLGRGLWCKLMGRSQGLPPGSGTSSPRSAKAAAAAAAGAVAAGAAHPPGGPPDEALLPPADAASSSLGGLGRDLWQRLRVCGQNDGAPGAHPGGEEALPEVPLPVASVRLLPEASRLTKGNVFFFCIEATPEGSLDAEGVDVEAWRVWRRYSQFRDLSARLGSRAHAYRGAPFPPVFLTAPSAEMLEHRRGQLEVWLQRVLQDPASHSAAWARHLREFLDIGGRREGDMLIDGDPVVRTADGFEDAVDSTPSGGGAMLPTTSSSWSWLPIRMQGPSAAVPPAAGATSEPQGDSGGSPPLEEEVATAAESGPAAGQPLTGGGAPSAAMPEDEPATQHIGAQIGSLFLSKLGAATRQAQALTSDGQVHKELRGFAQGLWARLSAAASGFDEEEDEATGDFLREPLLSRGAMEGEATAPTPPGQPTAAEQGAGSREEANWVEAAGCAATAPAPQGDTDGEAWVPLAPLGLGPSDREVHPFCGGEEVLVHHIAVQMVAEHVQALEEEVAAGWDLEAGHPLQQRPSPPLPLPAPADPDQPPAAPPPPAD